MTTLQLNFNEEDGPVLIILGDSSWHAGPGWYWYHPDYPDEGSCGPFRTREEAAGHALLSLDPRVEK